MEINFKNISEINSGTVVLLISDSAVLSGVAQNIDRQLGGIILSAMKNAEFKAKKGKHLNILGGTAPYERIIVAGTAAEDVTDGATAAEQLGGSIQSFLNHARVKNAAVVVDGGLYGLNVNDTAARIAHGAKLKSYRFDKYFTKLEEDKKPSLVQFNLALENAAEAKNAYAPLDRIAYGIFIARDLITEPPNVVYPESFVSIAVEKLSPLGVKVHALNEQDMEKLGMGALLGVGQGSRKESRLLIMEYNGGKDGERPVGFVGKGVCFDTGGISIKPSDGMEDMKYDMAGAAAVVGTMAALAGRKARVNAVGICGLVENMPDGNAQRPSDVVYTMSGKTIEVLNTDAEGRLVLADAVWYAQDRFNPQFVVDLATLTGAIKIALGVHKAGLFSNDDTLADRLYKAGEKVNERLWRLPMGKEYDKQIDSKIADVQNISNMKGAGSITAAHFIERFIKEGTPWAHLDIASTAWASKPLDIVPEGAVAFGVRLLNKMVEDNYEI